ncbi:hypothetical protein ACFWU3_17585 [Streptomyces sp. NPDC058685]|uniref:hypothetical protein n=1 Tax=Streptomyces sp. NPDC058685 TaxID=3346598 RepID=UPI0036589F2F
MEAVDVSAGQRAAARLAGGARPADAWNGEDPAAWLALDLGVRSSGRNGYGTDDAAHARPEIALCHGDGRRRRAALVEAAGDTALLPLVAIRCADWAEPVRETARDLLSAALACDPGTVLRTLTPLVLRLGGREQGRWARDRFEEALRGQPYAVTARLLESGDRATRRLAAGILLDAHALGAVELAGRAAVERDTALAGRWADAAVATMDAADHDEVVAVLLGSRLPSVRSAGVTSLHRTGRGADAASWLTDRSGLVRACARWALRQSGTDPHAVYRGLCADPATVTPGAAIGLAECGDNADADPLTTLARHPDGAVRARALAGLRLLDATRTQLMRDLLDDPHPGVVREASLALLPSAGTLPEAWLRERLAPGRARASRIAAFRLLSAQGGTAALRAAVDLLADEDATLRRRGGELALICLFPYPDPRLPRHDPEVGELVDRSAALMSNYVRERVRSHLGLGRSEPSAGG